MNSCVEIKNYQVRVVKKWYAVTDHQFEITFLSTSEMTGTDDSEIPSMDLELKTLDLVKTLEVNDTMSKTYILRNCSDIIVFPLPAGICGICIGSSEVLEINCKNGRKTCNRRLYLTDTSKEEIALKIWNDLATKFRAKENSVVVAKNCTVQQYKGDKFATCTPASTLWVRQ